MTVESSKSASRTDEAYSRLRSEIIRGEIRPNERLVAADLAERLAISRTPVREALQLLASEGLVVGVKRGYAVREHDPESVREIYEVRAALEGMAAWLTAARASDEEIQRITDLGAHHLDLARAPRQELVDANSEFHSALLTAAANPRLERINRRNSEHFFNYRIAQLYSNDEAHDSVVGHAKIVEALQQRDADAADAAARAHVFEALEATLRKLR